MKNIPIVPFNKCLVRVPFFPFNHLKHLDNIDYILSLESFKEAIYIASPELYQEVYEKGNISEKTKLSIIKYFIRACTRCTPYGIFAGCDLANIGEISEIEVSEEKDYETYLRIDMDYLCALIRILDKEPDLRNKLSYHVNTSLYLIKDKIRYIEYKMQESRRKYTFSEIKCSDYLDLIIESLRSKSLTIEEIESKIISSDITLLEARDFINDLIDEQILISDLEPSVVGKDLIYQIQDTLSKCGYTNPHINKIIDLLRHCNGFSIGKRIENYKIINDYLSRLYKFPAKNLFQVDCKIPMPKASIGKAVFDSVTKGIYVLNRLTTFKENEVLNLFKKNFYNRYEEQEISLTIALDPQIGVGIGNWTELKGDINTLIDDLIMPKLSEQNLSISVNNLQRLLISKYENFIANNLDCIDITEEDLGKIAPVNYNFLPEQLHSIVKVLNIDEKNSEATIFMDSAFGGSAARFLSRFGYIDNNINDFINEITNNQTEYYPDKILAEILHLPEDRLGNIQMHPVNRKYAIPYISNPNYQSAFLELIPIDDIMVSVPNGSKIVLRSKKYNKELLPQLTTAHNFSAGLPIYYFLCMLQHQNSNSIQFEWGSYFVNKRSLPRVKFENIILSPAKWGFHISDIPKQNDESFDDYYNKIIEWKNEKKLPDLIQIVEADNKLLLDFKQKNVVKILIKHLKTKKNVLLEEFLFSNDADHLVKRKDDFFTNEIIVCLHKK